jgi:CheY-like chemotaxis protein
MTPDLASTPSNAALRVLVVDDQAIVLQAMRNLLEIDGHLVSTCESGLAGVELFDTALRDGTPFEVVFTDFGMPGMDGGEVARHVKLARPGTWVVMLTGWGPAVEASEDWKSHVDSFLGKPPRLAGLRKMLTDARGLER